jgi:hypothetical protein
VKLVATGLLVLPALSVAVAKPVCLPRPKL